MKLHFFNNLDVASVLKFDAVERVLEEIFRDLGQGEAEVMGRHRIDCGSIKLSVMGGIWPTKGVAGIKSYPTVNGQFDFITNLFDLKSNVPLAIFSGAELTRFRTAAIVSLVARKACVDSPSCVTIFGFGIQGQSIAQALDEAFSLKVINIVDPSFDNEKLRNIQPRFEAPLVLGEAIIAVQNSDLIVTATRSKTAVFDGNWVKPGAVVVAIGTSLPNGSEIDNVLMARAKRTIVEWKPQSMLEAGEIVQGISAGVLKPECITDLSEIYRGGYWRMSRDEIVLFKSVGIGLADVATAWLAYNQSRMLTLENSSN